MKSIHARPAPLILRRTAVRHGGWRVCRVSLDGRSGAAGEPGLVTPAPACGEGGGQTCPNPDQDTLDGERGDPKRRGRASVPEMPDPRHQISARGPGGHAHKRPVLRQCRGPAFVSFPAAGFARKHVRPGGPEGEVCPRDGKESFNGQTGSKTGRGGDGWHPVRYPPLSCRDPWLGPTGRQDRGGCC